jgi:hypothetical protein
MYNINRIPGHGIAWKEGQKELIVELYQQGVAINEIKRRFGGLHHTTISKVLAEFNIQKRTRSQSTMLIERNSNMFHTIDTPEKAYWLGFMYADGFVGLSKTPTEGDTNVIRLQLHASDVEVVKNFAKFLEVSTEHVRIYHANNTVYAILGINDKQMATDLVKHGCYRNKSLTVEFPKWLPNELKSHFVRGYFDGDGGVSVSKNGKKIQMFFTGTYDVISNISEYLQLGTNIFKEHRCTNNTWRICKNGPRALRPIFQKMYENSTPETRMARKYDKYVEFYARYDERSS